MGSFRPTIYFTDEVDRLLQRVNRRLPAPETFAHAVTSCASLSEKEVG